ncbi:MAG: tetratricopeptide repeat protein [Actinomyces sp.]|uniref:tetratricopeptide repeat protein n=1 Tax=Actinomyces sp. TaxID=29317 RepID=UPI0026DA9597|nr:tetratricopeptide repeat protein [Actinomyces sp.]MDO4242285.1 tetratricopeptide repeat protein [Actinomyces sp.]
MEAVSDEARRTAREAIDGAAAERGLHVAEVRWDPAADAEDLEQMIVAAAKVSDVIHLSGAPEWLTPKRWQGLNIRRERLADSARARLVWWLHPEGVAAMADQAPDLWAWRSGVYSFLDAGTRVTTSLARFDSPYETAQVNRADPGPRRERIRQIRSWLEADPDPELIYEVAQEWGDLALSLGEFDEACHAYRDVALPAARLHHSAREVLAVERELAAVAKEAGDFGREIDILEDVVKEAERRLGSNHPSTLTSRNNLAGAYESAGRLDEAITLFEQTLTDRTRILGSNHPSTLDSRNHLAGAYESAGRLNEAITLYEQTLTDRTRILGPNHPSTLTSRNNLAYAYQSAGRLNEAIDLCEQNLTDALRILSPNHPHTALFRSNLVAAYRAVGREDDAAALEQDGPPSTDDEPEGGDGSD